MLNLLSFLGGLGGQKSSLKLINNKEIAQSLKLIYNTKEIGDNHNNYNRLLDKPLINSVELVGNITLNDINVYSKEEVKRLIASARSVKVVLTLPSPLTPNTTYYLGPDAEGIYTVYLTDSSDPINVFSIGTTSFGKYYSGDGINVTDDTNIVSVLVDSESVIINSEGLMEAKPVFEKMQPFNGASASVDGSGGIVPKPFSGDRDCFLAGDANWRGQYFMMLMHPVGSIYITYNNTNPGTLFPGTTWEKLATEHCLMTDNTGGSQVTSALPNVKGGWSAEPAISINTFMFGTAGHGANNSIGAKYAGTVNYCGRSSSPQGGVSVGIITLDASNSSSVYSKTTTNLVRPRAVSVCMWRRTA